MLKHFLSLSYPRLFPQSLKSLLFIMIHTISSVQSLSFIWLFETPWTVAHQASLSITNSQSLLKLIPSSQWCHPNISSSVIFFSCLQFSQHQGLFQWISSLHQVAKVLEFQLQHQSFQWIFRMIFWFDLPAVQGTCKSLQHLSSKA